MMLKQLIICSTLFLRHSVVWAGSIDLTVSGLNIFAQDANQADKDVQAINAVNGLTDATVRYTGSEEQSGSFLIDVCQKISEDVQLVTNDAQEITSGNQGVAATADTAVEDQVTDAFNTVSGLWLAISRVPLSTGHKRNEQISGGPCRQSVRIERTRPRQCYLYGSRRSAHRLYCGS